MRSTLLLILPAAFAFAPMTVFAHGNKGHQNLLVLQARDHRQLDASMKKLAQGLGVKCGACHVKGAFDSDALPAKEAARDFMVQTIGEEDPEVRAEALDELLDALEIERPKNEAKIWQAISGWEKKPARRRAPMLQY